MLGTGYGLSARGLAGQLGIAGIEARELLERHRRTYAAFWRWSDGAVDHAMLHGEILTVFGWRRRVAQDDNPRALRNYPVQANAAEILRLAAIGATEAGVEVLAPVHDALLIEAPVDAIDDAVATTRSAMVEAGRVVLGGFELRVDAEITHHPDRVADPRGVAMWTKVTGLVAELEAAAARSDLSTDGHPGCPPV